MSPSNSNKKSSSGPHKRYTTRQIMEFTEKRRKQMDEEARLELLAREKAAEIKSLQDPKFAQEIVQPPAQKEISANQPEIIRSAQAANPPHLQTINNDQPVVQSSIIQNSLLDVPVMSIHEIKEPEDGSALQDHHSDAFHDAIAKFTRQVLDHPARFEFPPETKVENKTEDTPAPLLGKDEPQIPFVDGKAVAAMFREQPQTASEQAVSDLIEREVDKTFGSINSTGNIKAQVFVDVPQIETPNTAEEDGQATPARSIAQKCVAFIPTLMEWAFTIVSTLLLVFMFSHVLVSGWSRYYYDLSSFAVLMAMSALWLNRVHLQKRSEWFWGSSIIIAGGLGVYMTAALEGSVHIQLAGFVTVCFGIFLWRYTEESALRLFFPLICLLFMLAPPDVWEQLTMARLNTVSFAFAADILNSFHLPALFEGNHFYVGPGVIDSQGDPTAFRSIAASLALAAVCVSFQNMTGFWSMVLFSSVVLWGVVGNILRVTVTGLMLDNFGVEYAAMFYQEYSVAIVLLVIVAGLSFTAGLLPHKEE